MGIAAYGPSSAHTRLLGRDRLVYVRWGTSPGTRYRGQGPLSWAHLTAKLQGESERSLADEAAGPIAQIIPVPSGAGDDDDGAALENLRTDVAKTRGRAIFPETLSDGFGQGQASAPHRDWDARRLGPAPPAGMVELSKGAFGRMLAACGCSPALFDDSDGTSKREALRQWHLGTVRPLARILEYELSRRLETRIRLRFDSYPIDLAGRAQAFQKLIAGGMAVNDALATSGLLAADD